MIFQSDYFLFDFTLYFMLSDSISDRTLVLLFNVPADLQSAGIEYKDFQSAYFLLLIYRYVFRIADPYTLCCRIAYPTEH